MRLVLALISCLGFAPLSLAAIESLDAETVDAQRPHFNAEGQNFFISTECSPHSLGVTLFLPPDQLEVTGTVDYVRSDKYRLSYSDMSITWTNQTFGPGFHPVSTVIKTGQNQDPVVFKEQVSKMIALVQRIEQGNICFPAKPEVREVLDYLKSLAT